MVMKDTHNQATCGPGLSIGDITSPRPSGEI